MCIPPVCNHGIQSYERYNVYACTCSRSWRVFVIACLRIRPKGHLSCLPRQQSLVRYHHRHLPSTTSTNCPVSTFQNIHAHVMSNKLPTFHPTSRAMSLQSHFLPNVKPSHHPAPAGGSGGDLAFGVVSTAPPDPATMTLLVTHICTVRDQPVVTPITIQARSGRSAPRNRSVRYVAGQQRHWSESRRVSVEGRE